MGTENGKGERKEDVEGERDGRTSGTQRSCKRKPRGAETVSARRTMNRTGSRLFVTQYSEMKGPKVQILYHFQYLPPPNRPPELSGTFWKMGF